MTVAEWAIGLAITVFGFYLTHSFRRQQRVKIAEQRVKSYGGLWEITDDARPTRLDEKENLGPLKPQQAAELYDAMTTWYFRGGNGMLLTDETKKMYLLAKRRLGEYAVSTDPAWNHEGLRRIRELSLLRSQMRRDLDIFGVSYFNDFDSEDDALERAEDDAFLCAVGLNPRKWKRPPWYRRIRGRARNISMPHVRKERGMRVVSWDDVDPEPGGDEKFTGAVERRELLPPQQHAGMRLGWVKFDDGARTNWHVHDGEQILYVIEGVGCVGTDHATKPIETGDIVRLPAGERHWHGAKSGQQLVHVAITSGVKTDWGKLPDRPAPCDLAR